MKYYKHMSNMSGDPVIKRIKRKFGLKGYGLYNVILEYISSQLEKHSPIPDLKDTAADIADEWNEDIRNVEEMMEFMVDQQLFTIDIETGRIVCIKMIKYLDEYLRKVPEIKNSIKEWQERQTYILSENREKESEISDIVRQTPDKLQTMSDNVPLEQSRIKQNKIKYINVKEQKNTTLDFPESEFPDYQESPKNQRNQKHTIKMLPVVKMFNERTFETTGRKYSTSPIADYVYNCLKKLIDKYELSDFETVTRVYVLDWNSEKMHQYIQIETLFGEKFEQYLDKAKALMATNELKE